MDAEELFVLLSDIRTQWLLARRLLEPTRRNGLDAGEVLVRGPLGLRRTARTAQLVALDPQFLIVSAELGARTVVQVCWALAPRRGTTEVELSLLLSSAGPLDRALLAIGGRRRLARHLDAALGELARVAALAAEGVTSIATAGVVHDDV